MAISLQWRTIYLYSAHRAVIFALAQLSCKLISYDDHCARLGIIGCLELRRLRADLILFYKIPMVLFCCRLMILSQLLAIELLADIV